MHKGAPAVPLLTSLLLSLLDDKVDYWTASPTAMDSFSH